MSGGNLRMELSRTAIVTVATAVFICRCFTGSPARAQETFRVAYGGYNEPAGPMWVGVEKGFFKKHGIDASMIQVRSGALSVVALVAKEVEGVWPALSTVLSTVSGGVKLTCINSPTHKIPRNLIVRKEIATIEELRGKVVGVQ